MITQSTSLYVFKPGGNRVELYGEPGYLIFDPEWKPVRWTEEEVEKAIIFYGSPLPDSFFFNGTPWDDSAFNPNGLFSADFVFGLMVWIMVWMLISAFALQGYPFYKLGQPLGQIIITALVVVLGYLSWTMSTNYISPSFSQAIGGSIIGWILFYSTLLSYYPFTKYAQPKRGIYSLIMIAILVFPLLSFVSVFA